MKCRVCRGAAIIDLARHNANFCAEHFTRFCHQQVEKAISDFDMLETDDRLLVAVSGGKDSLAVWKILVDLGYQADGLYIGLGIDDYSDRSGHFARDFAQAHDLHLIEVDLATDHGYTVPGAAQVTKRVPCSPCGLSKRHIFDRVATENGYDVLVTGHNLDDEAAVLMGNTLRWQTDYLARQHPVLPSRNGLPKKVKPLVRLDEREMAAYCVVNGIDYMLDECPMAKGNSHLRYKDALNLIEAGAPGSKAAFVHNYWARGLEAFAEHGAEMRDELGECKSCGSATPNDVCAFCRLVERVGGQPVALTTRATAKAGAT